MSKSQFDIGLEFGEIGEAAVRELLRGPSKSPHHVTIEVKRDAKVHLTGNLFIEYESRGKESGLNVTTADWWAITVPFYNDKLILFVQTKFLRDKLRDLWKHKWIGGVDGGDLDSENKKTSKGALVPVAELFMDRQEIEESDDYDEEPL